MPDKQFRSFPFELKSASDQGRLTGYAAVFSNLDQQGEVIDPGAFTEILTNAEGKIPLLFAHDSRSPIGVASVEQDNHGLKFDAQLVLADPQAQRALAHVKAGSTRGMSVGFSVIRDAWREGIRHLQALKLFEISLCVFGANPLARVEGVKSAADCRSLGDWEKLLRGLGVSKRKARAMALGDWKILSGNEPEPDAQDLLDVFNSIKL